MIEDSKNGPIKVTPSSEIGLTTKQREKLQRACGAVDAICYIAKTDIAEALTGVMEIIDELLAEDMNRKRGVPSE